MTGTLPQLELVDLEAQLKAAEAALAAAEAERDRGVVRAPWSGVVHDVAVEVGQAAFSFAGREIATIVALDPMLAVVEVAERKLAGIKVGDTAEVRLVTGERASGKIRFVAKTASQTTRTYRVEIELPNADGTIPDGITAEVAMPLAPVPATRIAALGADLFVRPATSACAPSVPTTTSSSSRSTWSRTSRATCGSPASPTARA